MVKPILYGTKLSPPVRSVLLTASAIGLELEFRDVNLLAHENTKPEFVAKNPQHTVPTLDDGGMLIWDSHAISTYLIAKYGKDDSLYPKDLYKRALIDQRLHFDSGILFVRLRNIFFNIIFKEDPVIAKEKLDAVIEAYDFLEKFLVKDNYLVGDSVTVADLCCIATVSSLQGVAPVNAKQFPKLATWMKRMETLPYYNEANSGAKDVIELVNNKIAELSKK